MQEKNKIRIRRNEGCPLVILSINYNVSVKTIQRVVKGIIPLTISKKKKRLNVIEVNNKYKELGSIESVARFYRISGNSVKKLLEKHGYSWDSNNNSRQYFFNTDFFNKIDTEEKAYWLGFLYADGSLHKNKKRINITLKEEDRKHLEHFANILGYKGKIAYIKKTNACSITLYSENMGNDLIKIGCMDNKTHKIKFPNNNIVPLCIRNHFIRGYFDGDGCITISKKPTFSMVGNYSFIYRLQEILIEELEISKTKLYKHKASNCYSLVYGGKRMIKKIAEYLYKDSKSYLVRKKERFIKWKFIL